MTTEPKQPNRPSNQVAATPEGNRVPRGKRLKDELDNISAQVKALESATLTLPYVNEQGDSECPFAENLYYDKEELEKEVSDNIEQLAGYLMALDAEKLRCRKELDRIKQDYTKLNLQETSEHYGEAALRQDEKCRSVERDREAVSIVLVKAKEVMKMAKKRKFPGRKPQRQWASGIVGMPVMQRPSTQPSNPQNQQVGQGNEIGGLMSLGPSE